MMRGGGAEILTKRKKKNNSFKIPQKKFLHKQTTGTKSMPSENPPPPTLF
jgi:hypothetical protein